MGGGGETEDQDERGATERKRGKEGGREGGREEGRREGGRKGGREVKRL